MAQPRTLAVFTKNRVNPAYAAARLAAAGQTYVTAHLMRTTTGEHSGERPAFLRKLTSREHEVLNLLAKGMTTTEAALFLGVSATTIKSHVSHALPKLNARNRIEAVLRIKDYRETATTPS